MAMVDVIIAVRAGSRSKTRCAGVLSRRERDTLVAAMLIEMLHAARAARRIENVYVVTPTRSLASLAELHGARAIREARPKGINAAFAEALRRLAEQDPDRITLLLPGDLPELDPGELDALARAYGPGEAVIAPSATDGGTAGLMLPARHASVVAFGRGSCAKHLANIRAAGLEPHIVRASKAARDVDRPADLFRLARRTSSRNMGLALRRIRTRKSVGSR
jgi:2-phospho-L-lactate guanylyltransferase